MKVTIKYKGKIISEDVALADNAWLRLSGYMFRMKPHVPGILFDPCQAIQTTFMFFSLDLVFLTKENQVVKIIRNIKPWRHTWFYFKARKTLELPAGKLPSDLKEGDSLEVLHV